MNTYSSFIQMRELGSQIRARVAMLALHWKQLRSLGPCETNFPGHLSNLL